MTNTTAPATHTTDSATVDPRELFARAAAATRGLLAGLTPGDHGRPTPCDDMDVAELGSHLLMVLERVVALGNGTDAMSLPDTSGVPEAGWTTAWDEAYSRAEAAWGDDAKLDQPMFLPWVQGPGSQLLIGYVAELTVHTWDLGRALDVDVAWDDDVAEAAWASYRAIFPTADRTERFAAARAAMPPQFRDNPPPFGNAVEIADDAPLIERVVAWTGRRV